MEDKSLELLTEEERKFFEEYRLCQNEQEVQALIDRENKLNESRGHVEITRLDMTLEEFRHKYHTVPYDEIMKKMGM